jgi:hypothetical protein
MLGEINILANRPVIINQELLIWWQILINPLNITIFYEIIPVVSTGKFAFRERCPIYGLLRSLLVFQKDVGLEIMFFADALPILIP